MKYTSILFIALLGVLASCTEYHQVRKSDNGFVINETNGNIKTCELLDESRVACADKL